MQGLLVTRDCVSSPGTACHRGVPTAFVTRAAGGFSSELRGSRGRSLPVGEAGLSGSGRCFIHEPTVNDHVRTLESFSSRGASSDRIRARPDRVALGWGGGERGAGDTLPLLWQWDKPPADCSFRVFIFFKHPKLFYLLIFFFNPPPDKW